MKSRKVTYVISGIDKSLAFEWLSDALKNSEVGLSFILLGKSDSELARFLKASHPVVEISFTEGTSLLRPFFIILWCLLRRRPQVIHTHLFHASIAGLLAAWVLRIRKRIFTRHHAIIHYTEHPSGVKWDKLCNFLATHILAVSENVKRILIDKDHADPTKVVLLHHGFRLQDFSGVDEARVESLRKKYDLPSSRHPVVGVISRYMESKGIQDTIKAFSALRETNPDAHLIIANATGPYAPQIRALLGLLPTSAFTEISFEHDLPALYPLFDVFVHVPTHIQYESFGQTYVEALAAGVPSVFTMSGAAPEFIVDRENALVVDHEDHEAILVAIRTLLTDSVLRTRLISAGKEKVKAQFGIHQHVERLLQLYRQP